jgi:hypothetical protein
MYMKVVEEKKIRGPRIVKRYVCVCISIIYFVIGIYVSIYGCECI